jgi:Protein of unknown function (DUF3738)
MVLLFAGSRKHVTNDGEGLCSRPWSSNGVNSSDAHGSIGSPHNRSHWSPRQFRLYTPLDPDEQLEPLQGQKEANQGSARSDSDGTTLFTAVNEQLGLQLKGETGPAGAIAIDHVEEPSAN